MNGSIELAPIVGLSEVIVDIVETGIHIEGKRTGRCWKKSVRFLRSMIVNPVSMQNGK